MQRSLVFPIVLLLASCADSKEPQSASTPSSPIVLTPLEPKTPSAAPPATASARTGVHGQPSSARTPTAKKPTLPPGHPPIAQRIAGAGHAPFASTRRVQVPDDGHEVPLALTGSGSAVELKAGQGRIPDEKMRESFAAAFRLTFSTDRKRRSYPKAKSLLEPLIAAYPKHPEALRTLGYVAVNSGFDVDTAMRYYKEAVAAAPNYGEAHYALAFMYALVDKTKGQVHYKRALELGVDDTRRIGPRYYPEAASGPNAPAPPATPPTP